MKPKKYIVLLLTLILIGFIVVPLMHYIVSPFGLFGDKYYNNFSYNMTQNPRVAKVEYLKKNNENYNAYIVGASGSSSFPTNSLNKYSGKKYYNMFFYGDDLLDSYNMVKYLHENYKVDEILLQLGYSSFTVFNSGEDTNGNAMHPEVANTSKLKFYTKYLYLNPIYFKKKMDFNTKEMCLPTIYTTINEKTGAYDKRIRDIEPIHSVEEYEEREDYKVFKDEAEKTALNKFDDSMAKFEEIIEYLKDNNIKYKVVMGPVFYKNFDKYDKEEIKKMYEKLSEITDFWDFSVSSISYDSRFFYDRTHWRNDPGEMMLSKIYGKENRYIPEDFGIYVQKRNPQEVINRLDDKNIGLNKNGQVYLPVLIYHDINEDEDRAYSLSIDTFKEHLDSLKSLGYNTISPDDMVEYVKNGKDLPEKPVLITFDDGYMSNYTLAYPQLKKRNMKASIFVIGSSIGKDKYKDTDFDIFPHFGAKEAKEMISSGLITIGSHTYDMHQSKKIEGENAREYAIPLNNEPRYDFYKNFNDDNEKLIKTFEEKFGIKPKYFAYPGGKYDEAAGAALGINGYEVTFFTKGKDNYLIKGLKQSLYGITRVEPDKDFDFKTLER